MRTLAIAALVALLIVGAAQYLHVQKAHQTFENYYAFRGCTTLLSKSETDATCVLPSRETIKLVYAKNGWYLDGDLPCDGPVWSWKYLSCAL